MIEKTQDHKVEDEGKLAFLEDALEQQSNFLSQEEMTEQEQTTMLGTARRVVEKMIHLFRRYQTTDRKMLLTITRALGVSLPLTVEEEQKLLKKMMEIIDPLPDSLSQEDFFTFWNKIGTVGSTIANSFISPRPAKQQ